MFDSRTERLVILLPWLLSNPGISIDEIAKNFKATKKEILQDIELLTLTGPGEFGGELVDIYYDSNYINVRDPQGLTSTVRLAKNESLLISMVLLSLMTKFSTELSSAATRLINSLMDDEIIVDTETTDNTSQSSLITILISCIENEKVIEFIYLSANNFNQKMRTVSPWKISVLNNRTYLIGYCHESKKEKTFRVSKIRDLAESSVLYLKESIEFNQTEKANFEIHALVHSQILNALQNLPKFQVVSSNENTYTVTFEVFSLEYCKRLALEYRGLLHIVEPISVETEINSIINGFLS